jgi:dynein heavy chain
METEAKNGILESAERGNWIMLQNCDLLPEWLPTLEGILEGLEKAHPDFRLWLTTKPSKSFPIGILQRSIKIVTEPPDGIKQNIKALSSKLSDEALNACSHEFFKPLNYVIMFFHAVLLDRKKFGKIGFNITYDFNESDFKISNRLLSLYLNKFLQNKESELPWDSLKYLIGDAMYGGRVTDEFDERVLKTYLEEYMGDFLFDKNNKFYFALTDNFKYSLPEFSNIDQLNSINEKLPIFDHPTIFGLHENAEITYFNNAAKEVWKNLLKMSAKSNGSSSQNRDSQRIHKIAQDILEFIPPLFDIVQMREEAPNQMSSTYVVLLQETERFNILIKEMEKSLKDLFRTLSGEIAINSEIEMLIEELQNGFLPSSWRRYCPQTNNSLPVWIIHFKKRLLQYNEWYQEKKLNVIWLAGLHIPESYLTAIIQSCCRKKKWALDKVKLRTKLTQFNDKSQVKKNLDFGCYVEGMFLEGASWSKEKKCIVRQSPKELISLLPLMEIVPIERRKLKTKDTISIPVYVTQSRSNVGEPGLVFNADLSSKEHESHWILQGIAIVLNKD